MLAKSLFTMCSETSYNHQSAANNNNKRGDRMKALLTGLLGFITLYPFLAQAGWQAQDTQPNPDTQFVSSEANGAWKEASPELGSEFEPFFEPANLNAKKNNEQQTANIEDSAAIASKPEPAKLTMLMLEPGTLKENIERMNQMLPNPWRIKWTSENDYLVTGNANVSGDNFYDAIGNLLKYYPVRAEFYTKNHVLSIVSGSAS